MLHKSCQNCGRDTRVFITKIVPPTGQSPEHFSYTNCVVFYGVFVTADAPNKQSRAMARYLRKPCLHGARVSLIGSLSFLWVGWGVNVGDCVVGVLFSIKR